MPAAARAEKHEELARRDRKREIADDGALAVAFGHSFEDDRHSFSAPDDIPRRRRKKKGPERSEE